MTQSCSPTDGSQSEFVRAWEAGAFEHRVELVCSTDADEVSMGVCLELVLFL